MSPRLLAALGLVALLLATGCIDSLSLDLEEAPTELVVDGLVTDDAGPHTVRLGRSVPFVDGKGGAFSGLSGADVWIESDAGERVALIETGAGIYRTPEGALVGRVGRRYALTVVTPEGERYVSRPERLRPTPALDSLTTRLTTRDRLVNGTPVPESGVEVRAHTTDPAGSADFYRWRWRGVYEAEACVGGGFGLQCEVCWVPVEDADAPALAHDLRFDGNALPAELITRVPLGRRIVYDFQVVAEQLSLTPEAFAFWEQVEQQRTATGSLFDPPPGRIRGNVVRADDPDVYALGYFGASAVTTAETCFNTRDFPERPVFDYQPAGGTCASRWPASSTRMPASFRAACKG